MKYFESILRFTGSLVLRHPIAEFWRSDKVLATFRGMTRISSSPFNHGSQLDWSTKFHNTLSYFKVTSLGTLLWINSQNCRIFEKWSRKVLCLRSERYIRPLKSNFPIRASQKILINHILVPLAPMLTSRAKAMLHRLCIIAFFWHHQRIFFFEFSYLNSKVEFQKSPILESLSNRPYTKAVKISKFGPQLCPS